MKGNSHQGWLLVLLLLVSTLTLTIFLWQTRHSQSAVLADAPLQLPPPPQISPQTIDNLLPKDSIPAIDAPQFETAVYANTHLPPDERIIGIVINDDARAYPIPILSNHEIVNDMVGGEPIAITWCPLCYTALVFSRDVPNQPQPLTFGVSGKLLQNTLVMFDRETNTLWSQLYGGAVDGPLTGAALAVFPSQHTEWAAWAAQYPESLVLSKEKTCAQFNCGTYADNPRGSYHIDPYAGYYNMPDAGVIERQIPREEGSLTTKERVLGVRIGAAVRAYPYTLLQQQPLIHDEINGIPLLIWFDPETETGRVFSRQIAEQTLTFTAVSAEPGVLQDTETGSRWQMFTGKGIDGRYRGQHLPPVIATTAFAFGWYGYFPHSDTYTGTP